jgi:hypothetical protein
MQNSELACRVICAWTAQAFVGGVIGGVTGAATKGKPLRVQALGLLGALTIAHSIGERVFDAGWAMGGKLHRRLFAVRA